FGSYFYYAAGSKPVACGAIALHNQHVQFVFCLLQHNAENKLILYRNSSAAVAYKADLQNIVRLYIFQEELTAGIGNGSPAIFDGNVGIGKRLASFVDNFTGYIFAG